MVHPPAATTLRCCSNCHQPFVGNGPGIPTSDVVACCAECYWSVAMDPTGARRREQKRKSRGVRRRHGGAGAAAAAAATATAASDVPATRRRRRQRTEGGPVAPPPVCRHGVRASTAGAACMWDHDGTPPGERAKWLCGCAVDCPHRQPWGADESEHAMFEFHMRTISQEEGVGAATETEPASGG